MSFYLNENLISWQSQKRQTMALSSYEVEFMAATASLCQILWLRNLLSEVIRSELMRVTVCVDNKYAIALIKSLIFHGNNKHIDTHFHFIRREEIDRCGVHMHQKQRTNIFTKTLARVNFVEMWE